LDVFLGVFDIDHLLLWFILLQFF